MAVDSLDPCGVYFGTTGGQVYLSADSGDTWDPIVRDLPGGVVRRGSDAAMIRVVLPYHLRNLARVNDEVRLEVQSPVTCGQFSMRSRPAIRCCAGRFATTLLCADGRLFDFYACKEDLSLGSAETRLPDAVVTGAEPLLIIGAMAGG